MGGIGQGVTLYQDAADELIAGEEIRSVGGWAQLTYLATPKLTFNLVAGIDDPDTSDLKNLANVRCRNTVFWGNVYYKIIPPVTFGLEYMHINTDYMDDNDGDVNRIQASFIYNF